jgi:hypothetical protein
MRTKNVCDKSRQTSIDKLLVKERRRLQSSLLAELLAIGYRGSVSKISPARENINGNFPRRSVKLRPSIRF